MELSKYKYISKHFHMAKFKFQFLKTNFHFFLFRNLWFPKYYSIQNLKLKYSKCYTSNFKFKIFQNTEFELLEYYFSKFQILNIVFSKYGVWIFCFNNVWICQSKFEISNFQNLKLGIKIRKISILGKFVKSKLW